MDANLPNGVHKLQLFGSDLMFAIVSPVLLGTHWFQATMCTKFYMPSLLSLAVYSSSHF